MRGLNLYELVEKMEINDEVHIRKNVDDHMSEAYIEMCRREKARKHEIKYQYIIGLQMSDIKDYYDNCCNYGDEDFDW